MDTSRLHEKLIASYTLFTLDDPETTRYFTKKVDYFVTNFPYFRDITLVTDYLTTPNARFNARFRRRLEEFVKVVFYESERSDWAVGHGQPKEEDGVASLYPSDESSTEELGTEESLRGRLASFVVDSAPSEPSSMEQLQPISVQPKLPVGDEFTLNPTKLVLQCFSRVLQAHAGFYPITSSFITALVDRLEYDSIHHLLVSLLQDGAVLPMLVKNGCVERIMAKSLKSLCALLENALYSSKNNIEDEEDFVDQVELYKGTLAAQFLEIGEEAGSIGPEQISAGGGMSASECPAREAGSIGSERILAGGRMSTARYAELYKILYAICMNRSSIGIAERPILRLDRFSLFYLRLLSYNKTPPSNSLLETIIGLFFLHVENSHLQGSVIRILIKTPQEVLKSLGFFERMRDACYLFIAESKRVCGASALPESQPTSSSLFSFLVRIYIRYSSYIETEFPDWEVFHSLMEIPCKLEKSKHSLECLELLVEYEGFKRYLIEDMFNVLPYSSIFLDTEIPQ